MVSFVSEFGDFSFIQSFISYKKKAAMKCARVNLKLWRILTKLNADEI